MPSDEIILRFLAGPTACGKSEAGILLAEQLDAEIISMDSMAVYRGMNVGTAKPAPEQRKRIPHHLIDVVDPWQSYSVARYVGDAENAAATVLSQGRQVLFVGGTGLYLKRFVEGIFSGPRADMAFRRECRERAICEGMDALHEELRQVDAQSAERIHPNDALRIIRALEVYHLTGNTMSELQRKGRDEFENRRWEKFGAERIDYRMCALVRERTDLNRRIDERVDRMFGAGLVDEVRELCDTFREHSTSRPPAHGEYHLGRQASQALGYRETLDYLNGRISLEQAVEQTKLHTHQFATKQMTWFRNFPDMSYIELNADEEADVASARAARLLA
ncbi:MAG: tRNA (adenosine(37)-N6)-dimethylallyltransferase MiaA [Planctomycetota bacterium]